ncbi:MAG: hypothetical protein KKD38_06060 [Candidatus Delongbacteria bacterium]|nr:hypothetical protein [Candidatus Delongbacteria bacterium]MCG2760860.1 hypothetical protein [Candidatus Delongbacteria bacterium]
MKIKSINNNKIFIGKITNSLSFIKGTPVLPVVSKKDVEDIINLLEELKDEQDLEDYEDSDNI